MPITSGQGSAVSPPRAPSASALRRRVFPGEERQLAALRRWLESLLPDCPARADVICVAVELAGNAVAHTASGHGGRFAVKVTWSGTVVRVAVADGGAPAGPRVIDDPGGEHGRGLVVVLGLSARTGVQGNQDGRLVWADVPWQETGATVPGYRQDPGEAAIGGGRDGLAHWFAGVLSWPGRSALERRALAGGGLAAASSVSGTAGGGGGDG